MIDPANARLVNLLFINMYLRGFGNPDDLIKRYNDDILRIFKNAVAANGEQIDYPALLFTGRDKILRLE